MALNESVECLNTNVELLRAVELSIIRDQELWSLDGLLDRLEVDGLWHLDLGIHAARLILS